MKSKSFRLLGIFLGIVLLLSACGNSEGLYSDKGQTLRKVIASDMTSLDSAAVTDTVSFSVYKQVYEGLYSLDSDDKAVPGVAKGEPKVTNDGKTYTFKLRKDAKWSNGDPVTAHDFEFAWKRVLDPDTASQYAYIMYDIKNAEAANLGKKPLDSVGVKALDDHTLKVELNKAIPYFKELTSFGTYMPQNEKVVKKYGKEYGLKADNVVYNGPFEVKNWKVEDRIQLVKNNNYWDKDVVKLDRVNFKVLKDQQAGASLFDTNSVDITKIVAEQVEKYEDSPALNKRLLSSTFYIKMNQKTVPAFKNEEFRKAIAKSINKKGYVDSVKNDGSEPVDVFTAKKTADSPNGKDFSSTIKSPLKYSPKEAQQHLEKAKKQLGKDKIVFSMNTEDTPDAKISAEFIKAQVEKNLPGVTLKVKQMPFKQRLTLEQNETYEASLSGWGPDYPDPLTFLNIMTTGNSNNNTGWSNKEYDQLVKDANGKLLTKPKERQAAMKKAEEMMLNDAPVAPIYQKGQAELINPQLKGIIYNQIGGEYSYKYAYFDKSIDRETGEKKK
ncbi:peptide ABC transporter substrate-binding protein [Staphylococcus massiliensis]|uniref:Peptide ABC transporter substrate-binding protein n=1 Tax=Staphylococcus massiliensis S46 TaxID=1229783 RepID=K9AZU2_9STAP|nr:peptide ABC transporter substrate-binding protein [Staphylococcus massiliensis]EKU48082.1 peptide ABC transporter substrate-binding protein [Staphylococcus massiliensis S46]MCG3399980.1 peptide ABC transporter substrate-binding protein [Staphylococcus massiliensis]MCG3412141.1 peptide ABC transporter substrate-binding protein [Staphylococcus massiliensis]POA01225.1 peptide ABC transporter substrate-binding protein [Staphylococcus massiliensis CCUG 55927]